MILDILLAAGIMVLALFINKMIVNWHDETIKAFRLDEDHLRSRLASAVNEQKMALMNLRDVKAQVVNYESMIEDELLEFKDD
ncbi:hypothetical protein [Maridesulfovibrio hydrothermalis]|uniref:Uncharacterized protein n=1 Tax=Maridesulfovibrio hydrothermalis AM13 = DSM 14728 TaxID=1121451 RepID=L0RAT7_9BACT|nr:hypothetical protein [Maridesulfovibrio hydrothermalis]CCO22686.1 conserved protein of unknown function [Maridesulfovibrio hydrothermalis AM13 = DSM 14728]